MENVRFAIKLATNRETGVISTTTRVILMLMLSINSKVPKIVTTPVNNWEKPIRSPSANWSTSATTRLTSSPWEWPSINLSGSISILANASLRISWITS